MNRYELARQGREQRMPIAPPTEAETGRGILRTIASVPFDIGVAALDVLDYIDASTRALAGNIFGVEGSGRETIFGTAPSGRELLGLGAGTKGEFEGGDVPGFAAEVALSPFNLLSFGTLSTAGKAASRAGKLAASARVAAATGKQKVAREAIEALAKEGLTLAEAKGLPHSLRQQATEGLRRGLTLDIPWGPKWEVHPFGGRASGQVFGGIERGRETAARALEPIAKHLRAGGRTGRAAFQPEALQALNEALTESLGGPTEAVELFNEAVMGGLETKALGQWEGRRLAETAGRNLGRFAGERPAELMQAQAGIQRQIAPILRRMTERFDTKIAEARQVGDLKRVRGLEIAKRIQLNQAMVPTRDDPLGVAKVLTILGVEKGGAVGQIEHTIAELTAKHANRAVQQLEDAGAGVGKFKGMEAQAALRKAEQINQLQAGKLASRIDTLTDQAEVYRIIRDHLPEPIRHEADRIKAALGKNFAAEQAAGVKYAALSDVLLGYLPRSMSRKAVEWGLRQGQDDPFRIVARQFQTTGKFTLERAKEFRGLSVPAINDLARARGFEEDFFNENVAETVMRRLLEGATARGGAHVAGGALTMFALPKGKAGEAAVAIEELIHKLKLGRIGDEPIKAESAEKIAKALKGTRFEGTYIPGEIASSLLRVNKTLMDPRELRTVVRWIEKANGWYRYSVTQLFPSFHARNKFSNMFMMGMAGMRDPRYLARAAGLQRRVRNRFLEETSRAVRPGAKIATDAEMKLMREIVEHAAVGHGYAGEIARILEGAGGGAARLTATRGAAGRGRAWMREMLGKVGTAIEDHDKIALYLWARDKGQTGQEAGRLVKKWLFDYGDLSHIEKKPFGLRSQAYFWTWTRKAIPLLFAELVTSPRKYRLWGLATGSVGSRRELHELLPSWLVTRSPFALGTDEQGQATFALTGLPPESLGDFATEGKGPLRALQKVAAQMAPLPFRQPFELLSDFNLRTGRPGLRSNRLLRQAVEKLPAGLRREVAGVEKIEPLLPTSRMSSSLTQLLEAAGVLGEGKRGMAETASRLLAGITPIRLGREEARVRRNLDQVDDALEQYERMGAGNSERAKQLRTLRGRLRRRLRAF